MLERIVRIQRAETNSQAAKRFLELKDRDIEARRYRKNLSWALLGWPLEGDRDVGKSGHGPGIKREVVLFNSISLPFPEKRLARAERSKYQKPKLSRKHLRNPVFVADYFR